jgi:Flp pilus assembly protein TadG
MKKMNSRHVISNGQRGQSLVELALSLTVILMLLAGAVDFGMAFFSYTALRDAAQEGALYGSIYSQSTGTLDSTATTDICNHVRRASSSPIDLQTVMTHCNDGTTSGNYIQVELTPSGAPYCQGLTGGTANGVKVTVGYNYPIIMPFLGVIIGSQNIQLRASVTDTILQPGCP